jgi:hypothetical protein
MLTFLRLPAPRATGLEAGRRLNLPRDQIAAIVRGLLEQQQTNWQACASGARRSRRGGPRGRSRRDFGGGRPGMISENLSFWTRGEKVEILGRPLAGFST